MTQASVRDITQTYKDQGSSSDPKKMNLEGQVRQRAYELYEERGRRDGHQMEDWIQAEEEVRDKYGLGKAA